MSSGRRQCRRSIRVSDASNAFRNWIDILSGGPVKRVYSLSGREHWNLERDGETVRLVRNADGPECLHTHVTFHLSGKRTAYELQRRIGQENSCQHLIAVNEQVRSILMVEGVMEGESRLIVHGLGNLSPAHLNALNPALLQDGPFATSIRQECRQEDIANFRAAGVL